MAEDPHEGEGEEEEEEEGTGLGAIQNFVRAKQRKLLKRRGKKIYLNWNISGRTKNDNFLKPKKISQLVQWVLDTKQRFLPTNDLRALLRGYISKRNLKVCCLLIKLDFNFLPQV